MKKVLFITLILIAVIIALSVFANRNVDNAAQDLNQQTNTSEGMEQIADMESYFAMLKDKENNIKEMSYEIESKMGENKTIGKFFKKDNMRRIENKTGDIDTVSIVDYDSNKIITYLPNEKKAFAEVLDTNKSDTLMNFPTQATKDIKTYNKGEMTEKNGYICQMLVADDNTASMCASEEFGIPVWAESNGMEMNVKNISTFPVDTELFTIPDGVQIVQR